MLTYTRIETEHFTISQLSWSTWYLWDLSDKTNPKPHYYKTRKGAIRKAKRILTQVAKG